MVALLSVSIDKSSPIPIYHQLQLAIARLIDSGAVQPGECLPSENDLSKQYGISPMTVRQAMSELVQGGYIERRRGRGTFVRSRPMTHPLDHLVSFSEDMAARQMVPSSRLLLLEPAAPPREILARVPIDQSAAMLHVKRLRLANGQAVGIHDAYLYNITVTEEDLDQTSSLYELLAKRGVVLREGEDTIHAVAASREVAAFLQVKAGSPLLRTTRFSWDSNGNFVEYVVALYRADLYKYQIRLQR